MGIEEIGRGLVNPIGIKLSILSTPLEQKDGQENTHSPIEVGTVGLTVRPCDALVYLKMPNFSTHYSVLNRKNFEISACYDLWPSLCDLCGEKRA